MLIYANPADLAEWTGQDAPANVIGLLRSASLAVREATELCFYNTDSTGMPTDGIVLQAFNDATCQQAEWMIAESIDPSQGGTYTVGIESGVGIGSARISYSDTAAAEQARQLALTGLCPAASRILRNAGLTGIAPWVVG